MRRLIADLAGLLSAYATTTFLVGEYREADVALYPEFAVADGISNSPVTSTPHAMSGSSGSASSEGAGISKACTRSGSRRPASRSIPGS